MQGFCFQRRQAGKPRSENCAASICRHCGGGLITSRRRRLLSQRLRCLYIPTKHSRSERAVPCASLLHPLEHLGFSSAAREGIRLADRPSYHG